MSQYYWILRRCPSLSIILCLLLLVLADSSLSGSKDVLVPPPGDLNQVNCSLPCDEREVTTQKTTEELLNVSASDEPSGLLPNGTPDSRLTGKGQPDSSVSAQRPKATEDDGKKVEQNWNASVLQKDQTSLNNSSFLTHTVNDSKALSTLPSPNVNGSFLSPTGEPAPKQTNHLQSLETFSEPVPTKALESQLSHTESLKSSSTTTGPPVTPPLFTTTAEKPAATTKKHPQPSSTTDADHPATTRSTKPKPSAAQPVQTTTESPAAAPGAPDGPPTTGNHKDPVSTVTRVSLVEAAGVALSRQLVDTASLLAVLLFGLLFLLVSVAVFVTQAYESYRRKDYTQVDYLINGMYSDSGV